MLLHKNHTIHNNDLIIINQMLYCAKYKKCCASIKIFIMESQNAVCYCFELMLLYKNCTIHNNIDLIKSNTVLFNCAPGTPSEENLRHQRTKIHGCALC